MVCLNLPKIGGRTLCAALLSFALFQSSTLAKASPPPDTIGIFDLKAIRSVPLDVETLSKTKQGDVNIEEIRFTSTPGVRVYAVITYKDGAKGAPGFEIVERFRVKPLIGEAERGFFGFAVSPPTGNTDPKRMDSVGGPIYRQPFSILDQFLED